MGTRQNDSHQHFLLFPQCFQIYLRQCRLTHSHTMTPFDAPWKQAF